MDKKAWIVITACVLGLAANWWYTDSRRQAAQAAAANAPRVAATAPATTQQPASPGTAAQPGAGTAPAGTPAQPQAGAPATAAPAAPAAVQPEIVATLTSHDSQGQEVAHFLFQNKGGSLRSVEMIGKAINSTKDELSENVRINSSSAHGIGTLMFNLSESRPAQYDEAIYSVVPELTNDRQVTLEGSVGNLRVRKTYSLKPIKVGEETIEGNAYMLDLKLDVRNTIAQPLIAQNWGIFTGTTHRISTSEMSNYTNFIFLEDGEFIKESKGIFSSFLGLGKNIPRSYRTDYQPIQWAGIMNQYYASLINQDKSQAQDTTALYLAPTKIRIPVTGEQEDGLELGLGMPDFGLAANTDPMGAFTRSFSYSIFTGPKLNMMLKDMTGEVRKIDHIMDYGWFYVISNPMSWLINTFHGWFGNWGWAIVAMTFVVRLCIWPLYRKSYLSMKRMSLLQPKMKELKEKYPDDQQKVSMEMMKLYRDYGISPLGGCLPMMLQLPIFLSFYYVLQTAAEFRGAPFLGWVTDLSQMDTVCHIPLGFMDLPVNVLPIIMAVTMIIQMHMTPSAGDPMQQKIMKFMPLLFFLFCYTFPSALALYWTTQNIISIGQTWYIRRLPMPELTKVPARKKSGKKSFMERMMDAQQAALAEQQRREKGMRNVTRK